MSIPEVYNFLLKYLFEIYKESIVNTKFTWNQTKQKDHFYIVGIKNITQQEDPFYIVGIILQTVTWERDEAL